MQYIKRICQWIWGGWELYQLLLWLGGVGVISGLIVNIAEGIQQLHLVWQIVFGLGIALILSGIIASIREYFRVLKITLFGTAYCEYHYELREYIVIVREIEVCVRRPITTEARCLQLKGDKNCYPSAEARFRASERWEQSGVHNMRFAPEIYDEDDMPEDLRNRGVTKGRIILGRWKSRWFPIARINVIREGDIVISK